MRQIVYPRQGEVAFAEVPEPACPEGGIKLRSRFTALSNGTERNQMLGRNYNQARRFPFTPGYQAVSEVVAVAPGVTRFAPGDLVLSGTSGTHAEFHVAAEDALLAPLPVDADLETAALLSVAAVSWRDGERAAITAGERVIVFGAGIIGQFAVQAARARGAEVHLVATSRRRLDAAERCGPVRTWVWAEDAEAIRDTGPFQVAWETAGADVLDAIIGTGFGQPGLVAYEGRVLLIAGRDRIDYSSNAAQGRALALLHAAHYRQADLDQVVARWTSGELQTRPLVTGIVAAADAPAIYHRLRDDPSSLFGTIFRW